MPQIFLEHPMCVGHCSGCLDTSVIKIEMSALRELTYVDLLP